jgi:signal transduction histidine kinase
VLSRLRIRQKLSLLLMIPLAAVVVTLVPFTAERIDDARTASATATTATAAREVGALIENLQQERLLAMGYLTTPTMDRSALLAEAQLGIDNLAALRRTPSTRALLERAGAPVSNLDAVRIRVLSRTITTTGVYQAYRDANDALLNALALTNPASADVRGLRQLGALDALMRANEEASAAGAVLVGAAGDRDMDHSLLANALAAQQLHTARFRSLVTPEQATLIQTVEEGKAGQRIATLVADMGRDAPTAADEPSAVTVTDALTAAISYTGLRRLAQDRIAREIATDAGGRARVARIAAGAVGVAAVLLLALVIGLGVTVSRSISNPLRRLTRAAGLVAEIAGTELVRVADSDDPDPAPPKLAAVDIRGTDEVGELAIALNRVQATAALLLERQVTSRRNVAVMFANIARRTQNLVGRQLSLIDDLERSEHDAGLLARLYRLDHVATRLRRSADSLLVVSGTMDESVTGTPTALVDVVRSALAEIEGFSAVTLGDICGVTITPGLVADLRLLLAELLENAASFSPPGTPVEVSAVLAEECRIDIVDHGLGMSATRLAEENRRLIERERLDLAPTTALGLFVVGRLARRHGLSVRLQASAGRGVTATVAVPLRLLSASVVLPQAATASALGRRVLAAEPLSIESGALARGTAPAPAGVFLPSVPPAWQDSGGSFAWFGQPAVAEEVNASVGVRAEPLPAAEPAAAPVPRQTVRGGLIRRTPGQHLPAETDDSPTEPIFRDPAAERAALDAFAAGASLAEVAPVPVATSPAPVATSPASAAEPAVAMVTPPAQGPPAGGLTRRVPGSHLNEAVRRLAEVPSSPGRPRDPEAERDELNDFLGGYDRGTRAQSDAPTADVEPRNPRGTS